MLLLSSCSDDDDSGSLNGTRWVYETVIDSGNFKAYYKYSLVFSKNTVNETMSVKTESNGLGPYESTDSNTWGYQYVHPIVTIITDDEDENYIFHRQGDRLIINDFINGKKAELIKQ